MPVRSSDSVHIVDSVNTLRWNDGLECTNLSTVDHSHRANNIPQRLAHLLALLIENHPVGNQRSIWTHAFFLRRRRPDSSQQLTLEPPSMLVRPLKTHIRSMLSRALSFRGHQRIKHRPRTPTIKPNIHRIPSLHPFSLSTLFELISE